RPPPTPQVRPPVPGREIVLAASSRLLPATDRILVDPAAGGATVSYRADGRLRAPLPPPATPPRPCPAARLAGAAPRARPASAPRPPWPMPCPPPGYPTSHRSHDPARRGGG